MDLRDKKGFITIYVMLAMMFFVVFVVTASVTASRKIKLQTEANSALFDIYSEDIDHIVQEDEKTIPIYTQAQFEQIIAWLYPLIDGDASTNSNNEYIYINDAIYFLDKSKYGNYEFILKTDLWFSGIENTDGMGTTDEEKKEDKEKYPYIPVDMHEEYKSIKDKINKSGHTIYLKYDNEKYIYDGTEIEIANGEDFLKIGTRELINGVEATPDSHYRIVGNIKITNDDYKTLEDKGISRDDIIFMGKIEGNGSIISGVTWKKSFFLKNKGTIKDLIFVNVNIIGNTEIDVDFGIIAGQNDEGALIENCGILLEASQSSKNVIKNLKCSQNLGGIVGVNNGIISNCTVQGIEIEGCEATNIGGIAGKNTNTIQNIVIENNFSINSPRANNVGGIVGLNQNKATVSKIKTDQGNQNSIIKIDVDGGSVQFLGGVIGSNENNESSGNSKIELCYINGFLNASENTYSSGWHATGGIVGRSVGTGEKKIQYCYSNVEIQYYNHEKNLGTGGIVGVTGWNGAVGKNEISNCTYVNEVNVNGEIAEGTDQNAVGIGGIVGKYWLGNSDENNELTIVACYMNGKIPEHRKSGAIIGTISNHNRAATINADALYNQAFRWIGFASKLTGIKLNYNCAAQDSTALTTTINTLKSTILSNIIF